MLYPERDFALLSQVAHMYYKQQLSQPEIAKKLFFSRSKVSRLLKRAEQTGIVEIKVKRILDRVSTMEQTLTRMFNLKDVIVISNFEGSVSAGEAMDVLTDIAALHLSHTMGDNQNLGISWGTTVAKVICKLHNVDNQKINAVQLMGATARSNISTESRELVNKICRTFFGEGYYLNTPLYVEDAYAKSVLMHDPTTQRTFEQMCRCDTILSGIGRFDTVNPLEFGFGYLKDALFNELAEKGAVGSICAQFYDINGQWINCKWNQNCIAMPFTTILDNQNVVAVASGTHKTNAIIGALRGNLINVLITDVETAIAVINGQNELQNIRRT